MLLLSSSALAAERTVEVRVCDAGDRCADAKVQLPREAGDHASEGITLSDGGRATLLKAPARSGEGSYVVLLANTGGGAEELLRGWVDRPKGSLPGERQIRALVREARGGGEVLTVGTEFENARACGRPVIMNARELDPATLTWKRVPNRMVAPGERVERLTATRGEGSLDPELPRLLKSVVASSATGGSHGGITDGKLDTAWQARTGEGELVVMASSAAVPVVGFQLVVRPQANEALEVAPRAVRLATDAGLFEVTLPEDARTAPPGTTYEVRLAAPLKSDCVSLMIASTDGDGGATIAELRAITSLDDEGRSPAKLVAMLDDGGERAAGAEALLVRGGAKAVATAVSGYASLSEAGKLRALEVIDGGSCDETAPFFADRLIEVESGGSPKREARRLAERARLRLKRCRRQAEEALATRIAARDVAEAERIAAVRELAIVAPGAALEVLVSELDEGSAPLRRELRKAIGRAATHGDRERIAALFHPERFDARPVTARLDLLRALGPELATTPGAADAFARMAAGETSFASRYLLLGPAGELARAGNPAAIALLRERIARDESPHVRARAARAGAVIPALAPLVAAALADPSPRVREAILLSLADDSRAAGAIEPRIVELLAKDRWTFVRVAAATALGSLPQSATGDEALIDALRDRAPTVRRAALATLGQRKSRSARREVFAIADDASEPAGLRATAIMTLGQLCHDGASALLYKLALRTAMPELPYDQPLGLAALSALGEIRPADLSEKLTPLLQHARTPRHVKAIVRNVLTRQGSCR